MKSRQELEQLLFSINGQGYGTYKSIKGEYNFGKYILSIDHVQVDPYAPPSKVRIIMNRKVTGIPDELLDSKSKIIAVSDFLTREFYKKAEIYSQKINATGGSGMIVIDRCGQEMLERTSVLIKDNRVEVRFEIGLPAAGRRVLGKEANRIFAQTLVKIVDAALLYENIDHNELKNQISLMIDQEYIREELKRRNLVAFVADGSVLPRESGVSDKPLRDGIPFCSPKSFEIDMDLPSGKHISGMGIEKGITLIVGGGYHGKSTLLKALERGVYNHISGDGREMVITCSDAVKIRAEDGRNVEKVNISAFINNLPGNKDTHLFSTENASGSTSQAANVMEALESGTSLILIDEDTSATNFMICDGRMQKLIAREKEPITPFIDKVKPLYKDLGVSTILIVGGCGDYFDVADRVIMMDEYIPRDVTDRAKEIASTDGYKREFLADNVFGKVTHRVPLKKGFSLSGKEDRLKAKGKYSILYGWNNIDISGLEQLVDESQTNCIAVMIGFLKNKVIDEKKTIEQSLDQMYRHIEKSGLDSISPYTGHPGNLAMPRKQEVFAAISRYRGLVVKG